MKITIEEYDSQYNIDLEAETLADAGFLVRLAMNAGRKPPRVNSYVSKVGAFTGGIYFPKRQDHQGTIICVAQKKARK